MRRIKKYVTQTISFLLSMLLLSAGCSSAFAAEVGDVVINPDSSVSMTIYKYDMTGAEKAGVWKTGSYVSTGLYDETVNSALEAYAIKGVVFSYKKVADLVSVLTKDELGLNQVRTGYRFPYYGEEKGQTDYLLKSLGMSAADAEEQTADSGHLYFTSDKLVDGMKNALAARPTEVRTDMEAFMTLYHGKEMNETDSRGMSFSPAMEQGLYLVVETKVPENVINTTEPFLVSLPMTSGNGKKWNYDVTLYPKNETGGPDLEKTVREASASTGKNQGSDHDIMDGYAHTASASEHDKVEYQILSTLPSITSSATSLTTYTFVDQLSKGITYDGAANNGKDLKIEFFKDKECTEPITSWAKDSGKFKVSYSAYSSKSGSSMTISMTTAGLDEINNSKAIYDAGSKYRGYSNATLRITYSATLNSDASVSCGDKDNPNEVTLEWKRTNTKYSDTLNDDCHVYTYGLDLTKQFSDDKGQMDKVDFVIHNDTDNYYVNAEFNQADGSYYVTGMADSEDTATVFHPAKEELNYGHIVLKGLEDDIYTITEKATDPEYHLLQGDITVEITCIDAEEHCQVCGKALKTAKGQVNQEEIVMMKDGGSINALVPLTIVNNKGFNLPKTGGNGTLFYGLIGVLSVGAGLALFFGGRKKHRRIG